jgi:hypothetical protein
VQLDDQLKQLLRELGQSINETVADSERINEAIARVRAAGYDIVLKLDATIGLARRDVAAARLTHQDRRLLESLHIRLDDALIEDGEEPAAAAAELSPQDVNFLKSLKIRLDETL